MSITDIKNHSDMYIDDEITRFPKSAKHLPLDADLGKVTARTLPPCRPFEAVEPFPLDRSTFLDTVETAADQDDFVNAAQKYCSACRHPKSSHYRLLEDPSCYHTFGCSCLEYQEVA